MIRVLEFQNQVIHFVELHTEGTGIKLDVRYAAEENFLKRRFYSSAQVFLLDHVASDLERVQDWVRSRGYGLLVFDGYRPWSVTKLFWDLADPEMRNYLADPEKGSSHNRGCAVDLSLYDLATGSEVVMPSGFDEMNEKSYADYAGGTEDSRVCREILKEGMLRHGFQGIRNEWWHFNHRSHREWPVMNFSFEEIGRAPQIQRRPNLP